MTLLAWLLVGILAAAGFIVVTAAFLDVDDDE